LYKDTIFNQIYLRVNMLRKYLCLLGFTSILSGSLQAQNFPKDSVTFRNIYDLALTKSSSYANLYTLCKQAPARLSGSDNAAKAVDITYKMLQQVADTAWLQETMVPHWERGTQEEAYLQNGTEKITLNIDALGGSIGTNENGVIAEVIEVNSLDELRNMNADRVKGKIVFINQAMDPKFIDTFGSYSGCAGIRVKGADEAADKGAVAVLIRSLALRNDDHPHTGVMFYKGDKKIPAAALSTNDANKLSDYLTQFKNLKVFIKMNCKSFPDVKSYNVIGEIRGSEFPDEIIVVGGHLDSWDNGEGAHDDGAGCVQSIDVLHILKTLGLKPKRTIRCVLFMNEENGARGADTYAKEALNKKEKHIVAIESDRGGFSPRGFSVEGKDAVLTHCLNRLGQWKHLFAPYLVHIFEKGGSGVDISRLKDQGVALLGFIPDSQRYFDVHHSEEDKFEHVNQRELELGSATMTALIWMFSEYGLNP